MCIMLSSLICVIHLMVSNLFPHFNLPMRLTQLGRITLDREKK